MSKFFRVMSMVLLAISIIFAVVCISTIAVQGAFVMLIASLCGVVAALALYTISDLMDRVSKLEAQLGVAKNDDKNTKKNKK